MKVMHIFLLTLCLSTITCFGMEKNSDTSEDKKSKIEKLKLQIKTHKDEQIEVLKEAKQLYAQSNLHMHLFLVLGAIKAISLDNFYQLGLYAICGATVEAWTYFRSIKPLENKEAELQKRKIELEERLSALLKNE